LISLCKSLNYMGQNQTAEKILCMRPNRGWSPGLMPHTETPPPVSEGRTWKASRGAHLSHSQQSRGQSLPSRACTLARA
jgi:hypothetical protein